MNLHTPDRSRISANFVASASLRYCSTKNTNLLIQVLNVTRASIVIKASSGHQRAGGMKEHTQDLNHTSASTVMNGLLVVRLQET